MASYNRVVFAGHLAADPVGKLVGNDMACRFTLVYNAKWHDKEGKEVEEVCFVDIEAWRKNADTAMKYLKKGNMVLVEGKLKQAKWIKDGVERSKHLIACDKIVLIEPHSDNPHPRVPSAFAQVASADTQVGKSGSDKSGEIDPRPVGPSLSSIALAKAEEIDDLPF